jgi:hypothetical protein
MVSLYLNSSSGIFQALFTNPQARLQVFSESVGTQKTNFVLLWKPRIARFTAAITD